MATCNVFKNGIQLGSGSVTAGATSITGYSATNSRLTGTGRNVQVAITSSTHVGSTFRTRVTNDGGATLTIADKSPFAT